VYAAFCRHRGESPEGAREFGRLLANWGYASEDRGDATWVLGVGLRSERPARGWVLWPEPPVDVGECLGF